MKGLHLQSRNFYVGSVADKVDKVQSFCLPMLLEYLLHCLSESSVSDFNVTVICKLSHLYCICIDVCC